MRIEEDLKLAYNSALIRPKQDYLLVAVLLVQVMDVGFLDILLAFVPSGFYKVTLLALLIGFDVAFVTFHHTIRVLMVFFTITVAVRHAGNRQ